MKKHPILRSMVIWLCIIPLAILNGGLREAVLMPAIGKAALPISGLLLAAMVYLLTYLFITRLGRNTSTTYARIGIVWVVATILFEFALGFITGDRLETMLVAYNILTGNLWLFVVIFIGFTPWLAAKARRIL